MQCRTLLRLFAVITSVSAQSVQPPPVYTTENARPKDMNNCRINANTALSWVVGISDTSLHRIVGHGSMITYIAFISTCRYEVNRRYTGVAQFIWNLSLPLEPCMQYQSVKNIYKHPKCVESPQMATFFDFAVFTLVKPFEISGVTYPTIRYPDTPIDMLVEVNFINVYPNTIGCMLPFFRRQTEFPPVFDFDTTDVEAIQFRHRCVPLLCERDPPNPSFTNMCTRRLGQRARGTMLCVINKDQRSVTLGVNNAYWYSGTPLFCNGSSYGIAAQLKVRRIFQRNTTDIHFVLTFLRAWVWIKTMTSTYEIPWERPINKEGFRSIEEFRSDAMVFTPSFKNLILICILRCFNPSSLIK